MKHFGSRVAILAIILLTVSCLTVHAGKINKQQTRAQTYALTEVSGKVPLGTVTVGSGSPGVTVGQTWYDNQQPGSVGRMIETGPHSGEPGATIVHMGWMHAPDSTLDSLYYAYNYYNSLNGSFSGTMVDNPFHEFYGGWVNIDVTPDNRALVGGHCRPYTGPQKYRVQIHIGSDFEDYWVVPDSTAAYGQMDGEEAKWPKFFFQFGTDTVLHVLAQIDGAYENWLRPMTYFRRIGSETSPDAYWVYPPYVVDSVPGISHDISGQRNGDRVAMVWMAHPPYQEPYCDTCSGMTIYEGLLAGQMDNDIYCQVSFDQGATWEPRVNITNVGLGEASYKAGNEATAMFDQTGYLHVIWPACPWPNDPCAMYEMPPCFDGPLDLEKARLMHWSENIPYNRTLCDQTYETIDSCGPPLGALRVSKPSLSECDGKLYAIWTQFNDISNGVLNDCAEWGFTSGSRWGAANGEIWLSVSNDGGMTWDAQRNLTNSYTPHCDPYGGDDCQSDYWASMNRWGRQAQMGEDWSGAAVVDPSGGSSPTDHYLDLQYVNDLCAGPAPTGDWTLNDIKWFRMPCVEPVPNPLFIPEWTFYGDPNYNLPGEEKSVDLDFENAGNVALTYTISLIEDNGPTGWLAVSGFSGMVPSGLSNIETGSVILNVGGMITTTGNYYGRLHVEGNDPANLPCDIEIELIVADTICPVWRDVVNSECLSLTANNIGNIGREGVGEANMDYYPEDCDSTATVYLFDGSPLVGRIIGDDTLISQSMWGVSYLDDNGFRPQCGAISTRNCIGGEIYQSGVFTTQDSTLRINMVWLAPADDCEFIIQYMKVRSFDGTAHDDIMLGQAVDWDIPFDYLPDDVEQNRPDINTGGIDGPRSLIYQQGYESYSDTGYPYNCQYNNERFAGIAFVESYLNGSFHQDFPYSAFVGENDVLQAVEGFHEGALFAEMQFAGLRGSDSTEDLHSVMTFEPALSLGATDVYEVVTILATIQQGTLADLQNVIEDANVWYANENGMLMFRDNDDINGIDNCAPCCQIMGDYNHDGELNPLDVTGFIWWIWRFGPAPVCVDEGDVNCSGGVDPLDIVYLVNYFWRGGPAPCDCSELP